MIALATVCSVIAYIVGWMLGFRFAAGRCPDCHEKRLECVCVTLGTRGTQIRMSDRGDGGGGGRGGGGGGGPGAGGGGVGWFVVGG